uniref:Uncharacterized protein n=1 Tax=Cacopsylla melanoneura TaxID=428564 RepID=A0A8D9EF95_9HEMI
METHITDMSNCSSTANTNRNQAFRIFYQNVNGLRRKTTEFHLNLISEDYDIIVLTETNLTSDIYDNELFDNRYSIFRQDRNLNNTSKESGGGIIVAIKNHYNAQAVPNINENEQKVESLWIRCTLLGHTIYICACYFSPPSTTSIPT